MRVPSWARRALVLLLVCGAALATVADEKPVESAGLEFASLASAAQSELMVEGTLDVSAAFRVTRVDVTVAFRDAPVAGTMSDPVRLSTPASRAATSLAQDDWALAFVLVQEATASGVFEADLVFDDGPAGTIAIAASAPGDSARLLFDIGPTLASSSAYVLRVRPAQEAIRLVTLEVASEPTGRLLWVGRGDLAGKESPALEARAGEPMRLAWTNEDGIPHDLVILSPDGAVAAGPTRIADAIGARATLDWTPAAPGDHVYACRIHRATMWGRIEVQ